MDHLEALVIASNPKENAFRTNVQKDAPKRTLPNGRKILESYELVDGVCKEVYRNVSVTEQLVKAIPSPYEAAQTAGIAVVATTAALSTPFLVRIIKPVVKKLLTKAKEIVTRKKEARPSTFLRRQAQRKARK